MVDKETRKRSYVKGQGGRGGEASSMVEPPPEGGEREEGGRGGSPPLQGDGKGNDGGQGGKRSTRCWNGDGCAHLLRGTCHYYHTEGELAVAEGRRSGRTTTDVAEIRRAYCDVVRNHLLHQGVTSASKARLLTNIGVSCPKPDVLPKLREVLSTCPYFVVEEADDNHLLQYVYLADLSEEGQGAARGDVEGAVHDAEDRKVEESKNEYVSQLTSFLRKKGAKSRETAVFVTLLGAACPRPAWLTKITTLIEEKPHLFGIEHDPINTAVKWIWLLESASSSSSFSHPHSQLPFNSGSPPSSGLDAAIAPSSSGKRSSYQSRADLQSSRQGYQDEDPDDVEDTSAAFVVSVVTYLRKISAVGRAKAISLTALSERCPKPLLLPASSVPAILSQRPEVLGCEQQQYGKDWMVWIIDEDSSSSHSRAAAKRRMLTPLNTVAAPTVVGGREEGDGEGFVAQSGQGSTPPRKLTTSAGGGSRDMPASGGGGGGDGLPTVKRDNAADKATYQARVHEYLTAQGAMSRSTAIKLKDLGVRCPKPASLTKIRTCLEESTLFTIEQDPKYEPVQWVWLMTATFPPTVSTPGTQRKVAATTATTATTKTATVVTRTSSFSVGKTTTVRAYSRSGTGGDSWSSTSPKPHGLCEVRDLFHPNPKERSYVEAMGRLREDIIRLRDAGILGVSLRKHVEADVLEFLGDAVLRTALTRKLVNLSKRFYNPSGLHQARMASEQRHTLARLFDDAGLRSLMTECPADLSEDGWKAKGDVVEAILGELDAQLNDAQGVPVGHPFRSLSLSVIDKIATAAIDVGQLLKDPMERRRLINDAKVLAP